MRQVSARADRSAGSLGPGEPSRRVCLVLEEPSCRWISRHAVTPARTHMAHGARVRSAHCAWPWSPRPPPSLRCSVGPHGGGPLRSTWAALKLGRRKPIGYDRIFARRSSHTRRSDVAEGAAACMPTSAGDQFSEHGFTEADSQSPQSSWAVLASVTRGWMYVNSILSMTRQNV